MCIDTLKLALSRHWRCHRHKADQNLTTCLQPLGVWETTLTSWFLPPSKCVGLVHSILKLENITLSSALGHSSASSRKPSIFNPVLTLDLGCLSCVSHAGVEWEFLLFISNGKTQKSRIYFFNSEAPSTVYPAQRNSNSTQEGRTTSHKGCVLLKAQPSFQILITKYQLHRSCQQACRVDGSSYRKRKYGRRWCWRQQRQRWL